MILLRGQHWHYLLLLSPLLFSSFNAKLQQFELRNFLKKLLQSESLNRCFIQLFVHGDEENSTLENTWLDYLEPLMNSLHNFEISGITVSEIKRGSIGVKSHYKLPGRNHHAHCCSLVIVIVNVTSFQLKTEELLRQALVYPLLYPATVRNRDKYLILTNNNVLFDLQKSKFFRGLKYKLIIVHGNHDSDKCGVRGDCTQSKLPVSIKRSCQYGLCKISSSTLINVASRLLNEPKYTSAVVQSMFPDHERNFFGHTLRLSTSTKVPQLLEFEFLKNENGKTVLKPKRGLYAKVLRDLSTRLNFTYEIIASSGNGSTGHALPNGTWVGTVGDTYHGIVDFGFMAAVTYHRFPYAEFCAPINFAYLGFVTGPPRKSFAWNAILWPFNPIMWVGLLFTCIVSAKLMSQISQSLSVNNVSSSFDQKKRQTWTYLVSMSFLVRGLLGQCSELPKNMTHFSFRYFLTFWLLFCLVITTAYCSKMVSLLTFPVYDRIPDSFDELAVAKDFSIDFHYFGNVGYSYFKTSTNPSFISIFQRMGREPSPLKCLQRTLDEKAACIIFILTFSELVHRNLSDQYGGTPLKFTRDTSRVFPAGVIHEYKAPLSSNFQSVLFPAMETGLIPFWEQTDLNQVLDNKNRWQKANNIDISVAVWGSEVTDTLLRVRNLKGAFMIFGLGIIVAVFAFIVEKTRLNEKFHIGCRHIGYDRDASRLL